MRSLSPVLAAILTLLTASAVHAADCAHDHAALLALDLQAFDKTLEKGWRVIGDVEGCEAVAAALIADYRRTHAAAVTPRDDRGLAWHEGQLRAMAGDYAAAIPLFALQKADPIPANSIYADATVAFLRRDLAALQAARARLAALPPPKGFEVGAAEYQAKTGQALTWPTNLNLVDGLIACFDKPYKQAYTFVCRPRGKSVS
jgi:hypothetical protein